MKDRGQRARWILGAAGAFFVALAWRLLRSDPGRAWIEAYSRPSQAARLLTEHDHAMLLGNRSRP